ncbi:rho GTPase-activating protein conundrum isoform X3 [Ischnura elegans]|uniref:rho GTPase-activating protein conundrum isoform X3 n=1 Tax=Ischnura elegans TaxID=197161 RepID=UPI001ED87B8F|nr:rho GTPase-activating protein conundrum isoform X3 [Ischnura elegans]
MLRMWCPCVAAVPSFSLHGIRCLEPSAMDARDYEDYFNEYQCFQEARTPSDEYIEDDDGNTKRQEAAEEGEEEAQWLRSAGLSSLAEAWVAGREVAEADVAPALRALPPHHASAVRRRVDSLNRTLRARRRRKRDAGPRPLPEEDTPPPSTSPSSVGGGPPGASAILIPDEEQPDGNALGGSRRRVPPVAVGRKCAYNRSRPRKPDIREVFKDIEASSTGTRSRSATPDSLDLDYSEGETRGSGRNGTDSGDQATASSTSSLSDGASSPASPPVPRFVQVFHPPPPHFLPRPHARHPLSALPPSHPRILPKDPVRRVNSLGHDRFILSANNSTSPSTSPPSAQNLFRRSQWDNGVVANDSDGVRMVGYQQIGTLHLPRTRERRSGSDPSSPTPISSSPISASILAKKSIDFSPSQRSEDGNGGALHFPLRRSASQGLQGIRTERWQLGVAPNGLSSSAGGEEWAWASPWAWGPGSEAPSDEESSGRTWVWSLADEDVARLKPLALLEATALLDEYGVTPYRKGNAKNRRKKQKNRKDENHAVFGVPLSTLLERDKELTGEDIKVPLILQKLIGQLEHGLCEQGILRVAGHNAKVEGAKQRLDQEAYRSESYNAWNAVVDSILSACSVHDLSALLKRFMRDLPEPLLTLDLVETFYRCHVVPDKNGERDKALNALALMLPAPNRDALRVILSFLERVSNHEASNRMSTHNVAMVMAPNLFPPRHVDLIQKGSSQGANSALETQVEFAAVTCRLTEALISSGDNLWLVPSELLAGIRRQCIAEKARLLQKENNRPMKKLLGRRNAVNDGKDIGEDVNLADGTLRISAPKLGISEFILKPMDVTTAGDVVLRVIEEAFRRGKSNDYSSPSVKSRDARRGASSHPLMERFAANISVGPSSDPDHLCPYLKQVGRGGESPTATDALISHSLYEVGGNLNFRQLEHNVSLVAVLKQNPGAHWVVWCHHQKENDVNNLVHRIPSSNVNVNHSEKQNGGLPHDNQRYF